MTVNGLISVRDQEIVYAKGNKPRSRSFRSKAGARCRFLDDQIENIGDAGY
jgi:hypothetical protein